VEAEARRLEEARRIEVEGRLEAEEKLRLLKEQQLLEALVSMLFAASLSRFIEVRFVADQLPFMKGVKGLVYWE
jgi:hypothetical protein